MAMRKTKQNIIITGGAGYIGSHTCKALSEAGYQPVVYDNLVNGHRDFVQWGPLEFGDIMDARRLHEVFDRYEPLAVIHFAGLAYVGESVAHPNRYYRNNVVGSLVLLEVMRSQGVGKIISAESRSTVLEIFSRHRTKGSILRTIPGPPP